MADTSKKIKLLDAQDHYDITPWEAHQIYARLGEFRRLGWKRERD